jgi:hypothetical protein
MTLIEEAPNEGARYPAGPLLPIEREIARGFRFALILDDALQRQADETRRVAAALSRLLISRGVIGETVNQPQASEGV